MNIISLFDGISCGQVALNKIGFHINKYYASEIDKYSIAITKYNFPKTIHIGNINNVNGKDYSDIDLLLGGSPCFIAGTNILTKNGYKSIEDIMVGDEVLTHTGNWRKVLKTGFKENIETRILKGYGNIGLETTNEHPFFTKSILRIWNNQRRVSIRTFTNPIWKEAKNLTSKDYCAIVSLPKSLYTPTEKDSFFWYMIGRYTGDRWFRKTKRKNSFMYQFIICCGKHEFLSLKEKFDKFGYIYNFSEERTTFKFRICNKPLVEFVEKIGKGASNKIVHPDLFITTIDNMKSYLNGLWDSDGNYRKKDDTFRLGTTSYKLALGIQQIIITVYNTPTRLGYTKRPKKTIIEGRVVNQKDTYTVSYKLDKRKQDKAFFEDIYSWMPIKKNESTNTKKRVYNLEVEIDNSYTANNIIVHNCQGFSNAGRGLNFNDPRSSLFFEYIRILKECKPKWFLLENVKMKKEWADIITEYMGVEPIEINSSLVSAQNRVRYYWTNIPINPIIDKNILLKDIILSDASEPVLHNIYGGFKENEPKTFWDKSPTLRTSAGGGHIPSLILTEKALQYMDRQVKDGRTHWDFKHHSDIKNNKSQCVTANFYKGIPYNVLVDKKCIRYFHPIECERLQTLQDNYTQFGNFENVVKEISNTQRYKSIGNGWTVDVIAEILKGICEEEQEQNNEFDYLPLFRKL